MPKCDFNKVTNKLYEITLWNGCSNVNLLHIFRILFPKNPFGGLLLKPEVYFLWWTKNNFRLQILCSFKSKRSFRKTAK